MAGRSTVAGKPSERMAKRKRKSAAKGDGGDGGADGGDNGAGEAAEGNGAGAASSIRSLYEILGVERTATQVEIKKAYHKLALRLHPDKNPDDKDANEKFQTLQNVFAVLGDPEKRAIYDETGSVEGADLLGNNSESLYEFFRTLYKPVTEEDIENFSAAFRGSDAEKKELKDLYTKCNGNMDLVFDMLVCSDPKRDSHRFKEIIDDAITSGELKEEKKYWKWAIKTTSRPAPANPLESKKNSSSSGSGNLLSAIQLRGKQRMDTLTSALEAKYGGNTKNKNKNKMPQEPTEEEFQAARAKQSKNKKKR